MKELSLEQKAKRYDEAFRIAQELYNDPNSSNVGKGYVCTVFPEVKESDDENIRKWIITQLELKSDVNNPHDLELMILKSIAWLEKQGNKDTQVLLPTFTFDDILVLQCCMETTKKVQEDKDLYEKLNDLHGRVYDAYQLEKRSDNCLVNFDEAEKEKYDFVGDFKKYIKGE